MPGLYKIGHTVRDPRTRCEELYRATACPSPFRLLAYAYVSDAEPMERTLHTDLSMFRHNQQREFFRCKSANWLALAIMRHPAAVAVGGDVHTMLELGSEGWFNFNPWHDEDECSLDPRPRFVHPELQDARHWSGQGLSWPILDHARFCVPKEPA
jgi:hypothetical protein